MLLGVLRVGVFLTCFAVGAVYAQVPGEVPDLSIWENTWFKVKMTSTVYHFSNIGVKPTPGYTLSESGGTSYINIVEWDTTSEPGDPFLVADVYARESGFWVQIGSVNIYYFAGSDLKFVGSARVLDPLSDDPGTSLTLLFVFTGKRNKANTAFIMDGSTKLSTMGSALFEIDDAEGSTERWAGAAKLSGPMVPVSTLPPPLQGL
jgi:hypothetical protein